MESSTCSKWIGLLAIVALLVVMMVAGCCPRGESGATPTPADSGWYWKPGDIVDYAPSGMPDFDQKQDEWKDGRGYWSYCGPVAEANSLWWLDSQFESNPVQPPELNDNFPLVESYSPGQWDDHYTANVDPLVMDLALLMDTDGQSSGGQWYGTYVEKMHVAVSTYLMNKGLSTVFYAHLEKSPDFSWIIHEVERCQDVVLLLGFWQEQDGDWVRIGGHYVTCAGVNADYYEIGISDPYWDCAEADGVGRVVVAHTYPHGTSVHNDAEYVSHDIYQIVESDSPGGIWALEQYAEGKNITNFIDQNWASDLLGYRGDYVSGVSVQTEIEYAIAVSPLATPVPSSTPTPGPFATPTPTPTPTVPPPDGPIATPTVPASTPEGTPITTPVVTPKPSPTPPAPKPGAPVITGIRTKHHTDPATGQLIVEVHCIPAYFPHGTNIYDLHFFTSELQHLGSVYFDTPMEPCTWYTVSLDIPQGVNTEFVIIYVTDKDHNIWAQFAFYKKDVSPEAIKSPAGINQLPLSGSLTPEVTVRNFGSEAASFDVTYHLESYDGTVTYDGAVWVEGLASGEAVDVAFPSLPAEYFGPPGSIFEGVIWFSTHLYGDEVPKNDILPDPEVLPPHEFQVHVLP